MLSKRLFLAAIAIWVSFALFAQPIIAGDQELAKKSQNPIGDLISLPIIGKVESGLGPADANAFTLELKPVYPVHLGSVNMINRLIVPVVYQEALVGRKKPFFIYNENHCLSITSKKGAES